MMMNEKAKPCIVSCSVLKQEIEKLIKQGKLDAETVFVSKYFHVDYALLDKNLRQVLQKTLPRAHGGVILVYGDLCLGPNDEMKNLVEEYGIVKVDALNCIDCLLGGKGKVNDVDPDHDLLFLYPGMIGFFSHFKEKAKQENVDEEAVNSLFSGLKGIVLLDTLGEAKKNKKEIQKLRSGLTILETNTIGLDKLKQLIQEAIERNKQKTKKSRATKS
jgi:hypothetical protein